MGKLAVTAATRWGLSQFLCILLLSYFWKDLTHLCIIMTWAADRSNFKLGTLCYLFDFATSHSKNQCSKSFEEKKRRKKQLRFTWCYTSVVACFVGKRYLKRHGFAVNIFDEIEAEDFLYWVMFSDEATFLTLGDVRHRNVWVRTNEVSESLVEHEHDNQ